MQYPEYQLFEETVRKDIAFGPLNMGLSKEEVDQRVEFAADMVGLKPELLESCRLICRADRSAAPQSQACLLWSRRF